MSQYKAIPEPTDQRNVSQNDILTNFQYLSTPLNPTGGVPNGIIPVDHFATGDNVANPTDGFHKQASFQDRATPANLTNSVNSQVSSGILYSKTDGQPTSQLRYLNSIIDSPLTYIKAAVNFQSNGAIIGNAFNVTSVTPVVKPYGTYYTITFTVAQPNIFYMPFGASKTSSTGATVPTPTTFVYGILNPGDFSVWFQSSIAGTAVTTQACVYVIGFN